MGQNGQAGKKTDHCRSQEDEGRVGVPSPGRPRADPDDSQKGEDEQQRPQCVSPGRSGRVVSSWKSQSHHERCNQWARRGPFIVPPHQKEHEQGSQHRCQRQSTVSQQIGTEEPVRQPQRHMVKGGMHVAVTNTLKKRREIGAVPEEPLHGQGRRGTGRPGRTGVSAHHQQRSRLIHFRPLYEKACQEQREGEGQNKDQRDQANYTQPLGINRPH